MGRKKKICERVEDRKVHLMGRGFTKDLTSVGLNYDFVEGPHTLHLRLFHQTMFFFFGKRKRHFGNLLTLSSGQRVKRFLNIQGKKMEVLFFFFFFKIVQGTSVTGFLYCLMMNAWPVTSSYTIVPPSGVDGEIYQGQGSIQQGFSSK